ncbi:enamine deaminase RidA (YjgF/YER057c/UK114 family) [Natronocella acetinitrilica]|uniref:Enamine deaminase RidA (YjgF/YER057c/UK114 family) n=1 Tax=Natronocella acetinitrilica TaxID=414046 RepID=A0AAE3KAL0_9GAMM|nr:RidA family protein [Natronocella acetinitrilica]MCP1673669.1 enamine deaminase RidA (YjgF/YER057c/UK114 family) [Natronocella acetinitrilica]
MATMNWAGLKLPRCPQPAGNFRPYNITGNLVFLAGQTCQVDGRMAYTGKVGEGLSVDEGYQAARICMQNLLAALALAIDDDWTRVQRCIRLTGYVNAAADFAEVPRVINGASDLIGELMGENGHHARTAIGVATLPGNAAVEVEGIFEISAATRSDGHPPPFVGGA